MIVLTWRKFETSYLLGGIFDIDLCVACDAVYRQDGFMSSVYG